jgi:CRISPR/Cas system Type II protein with McrA/HNH and RuvC-like nuclease domain
MICYVSFHPAKKLIGQPQVWSVQVDNGLRFAFDFGAGTIGWAVYRLEDGRATELVSLGSRIFDDGRDSQTKESNAKKRREPRAMRRGYEIVPREMVLWDRLEDEGDALMNRHERLARYLPPEKAEKRLP